MRRSQLMTAVSLMAALGAPRHMQAQVFPLAPQSRYIVSTTITPGEWSLRVTSGAYDEVSGQVHGCDVHGANCDYGWITDFDYRLNGGAWIDAGDSGNWSTPELAFANAPGPVSFTVAADTHLEITVLDSYYPDNAGSLEVTLEGVESTPEPASMVLVATGLLGVGVVGRGRNRNRQR